MRYRIGFDRKKNPFFITSYERCNYCNSFFRLQKLACFTLDLLSFQDIAEDEEFVMGEDENLNQLMEAYRNLKKGK